MGRAHGLIDAGGTDERIGIAAPFQERRKIEWPSTDGLRLLASFGRRDRAVRWQFCRRRRRDWNRGCVVEDVIEGAGQAGRLREQGCERAVHEVVS